MGQQTSLSRFSGDSSARSSGHRSSSELDPRKDDIAMGQETDWLRERIINMSPRSLEELTAALLRAALGYSTRVSPQGSDRGIDVQATPDDLGLLEPRIKTQVKHRPNRRMTAPEVRELIGALRPGNRGLCISTGGFTREARYEAERSEIPISLVDFDEFLFLILKYYEQFDPDGRAILPLKKIYWPEE